MTFKLHLDPSSETMIILPETIQPESRFTNLLSSRDPDQPLEFKVGFVYLNPLLKNPIQAYLMTPEGPLGYQTNKPPGKYSKTETAQLARGWFEIVKEPLSNKDLPPQLIKLITKSPKLTGVIAQNIRAQLGLPIPANLQVTTPEEWFSWLANQELPLRPQLRHVFTSLFITPLNLNFSRQNRHFMLTGAQPEPEYTVKLRWLEIRESQIITQQLYESMEWQMNVPESVLIQGTAAILEFANNQFNPSWAQLLPSPTGENILQKETAAETTFTGPLIFYRPEHTNEYTIYAKDDWNRETIPSVIDLLNKATKGNNE
jgi:hypothetical protein